MDSDCEAVSFAIDVTTQTQPYLGRIQDSAARPRLEIRDLGVIFGDAGGDGRQAVRAVDGASLTIHPRQTLAVVGESGCGKSVTALSIMRLIRAPGRIDRGSVHFEGRNLLEFTQRQMLAVRGRDIAMIFQEPMTSLNPVFSVGDQIMEAIGLHQRVSRRQAREIAEQAMLDVGIRNPGLRLRAYPHQFSGGMRQRVMIAMALACQPKLLLADEPTTALDVTIQAQILDLLRGLQRTRDMSVMLITHDLGVVAQTADVVCVMYAGRVVEYAKVTDVFDRPLHPYTRGLLRCRPAIQNTRQRLATVAEVVSDPQEFKKLPGANKDQIPWWPRHAESGLAPLRRVSGPDSVLQEVEPEHWVACWRTEFVAWHPSAPVDIQWRRE